MNRSVTDSVLLAAELSEAVGRLPAVAMDGWCDLAAQVVGRVVRNSVAVVGVATIDEHGRVRNLEAVGCAEVYATARPVAGDGGRSACEVVGERAASLSALGWTPGVEGLTRVQVGMLSQLPGGRNWRASVVGRVWAGVSAGELLVGVAPLGGVERGRVLLVQVMPMGGGQASGEDALVLRALLPVLAHRAQAAFGPLRSSPAQWLTRREKEVLDQLILGRSVKEIADALGRSRHTVHDHVKALHRKLGARSRGELIARALGHAEVSQVEIKPAPAPDRVDQSSGSAASGR